MHRRSGKHALHQSAYMRYFLRCCMLSWHNVIEIVSQVDQISIGKGHMCAVLSSGRMKCWGENDYGQLGYEDRKNRGDSFDNVMLADLEPVDLGTYINQKTNTFTSILVREIGCGYHHTCAIIYDYSPSPTTTKVKCWGRNDFGVLGLGDTRERGGETKTMGNHLPFVNLGSDIRPWHIAVGDFHTCVLTFNARIKCWVSVCTRV